MHYLLCMTYLIVSCRKEIPFYQHVGSNGIVLNSFLCVLDVFTHLLQSLVDSYSGMDGYSGYEWNYLLARLRTMNTLIQHFVCKVSH